MEATTGTRIKGFNRRRLVIEEHLLGEALNLDGAKSKLSTKMEVRAYNKFRMKTRVQDSLEKVLFSQRVAAFEEEVDTLLGLTGCRKESGSLTNVPIRDRLLSESVSDAGSIVNTHSVHLVGAILRISKENKSPTWQDYVVGLTEWQRTRDTFKVKQVSTWTVNRVRHEAAQEFYGRNFALLSVQGSVILRGPLPAKEPICQGWINRGVVPLMEALSIDWPPHLNCEHYFDYVSTPRLNPLARFLNCRDLWVGG